MLRVIDVIKPDWSAPQNITAFCTTREGGVSKDGFFSLNLASHVNDDPDHVHSNRQRLIENFNLPSAPQWLNQSHSIRAINLDTQTEREGDAAYTAQPGKVAVVLTADCLPVLLCNQQGSEVAAAHAGWRGLVNGVLEQTIESLRSAPEELFAWMGPAIGPQVFEVGAEVRAAFMEHSAQADSCFTENRPGHYLADLYALARLRLKKAGINHISGEEYCTYSQQAQFFSYRRDKNCGRQASLIYINP